MNIKLTVFFDDPFWVGVFEKTDGEILATSRVVFGAEPKDYEVYSFVLANYYSLPYSQGVEVKVRDSQPINPKRLQRVIRKETTRSGIGTKAQQAIKLQQEEKKLELRKRNKEKKEETDNEKFERRQLKKKEKHKGH